MKIIVGSKNPAKVEAVREIILDYPSLAAAQVGFIEASTGVSDQPMELEETIRGAKNRALVARESGADYGIGLESGLMLVSGSKTGYMDVCVCAIYDGQEYHIGLSSAWEFPDPAVLEKIKGGMNMTDAVHDHGLTDNPQIGYAEGAIGIFTKGRLNRKEYTKQALRTALIHLDK